MSHFKAKMHSIRFQDVSVCPFRWSFTLTESDTRTITTYTVAEYVIFIQ